MDLTHESHEFKNGDRGFSHYVMAWGTVIEEPDGEGWFDVRFDDGSKVYVNAVRFVTPQVAQANGYGEDPFMPSCWCGAEATFWQGATDANLAHWVCTEHTECSAGDLTAKAEVTR